MGETHLDNEMENDGEDGDDSYANAYLDDDDVQESDDAELAEMLAKVQSIQQVEGRLQLAEASAPAVVADVKDAQEDEAAAKVKTAVYEEKLLQAVKTTSTIERLRQKAVAAAPATIGKRVETLSAPSKKSNTRKFATDDEEQHCRFQLRKNAGQRARSSSRDDFDSAGESGQNFISRMEAAERNRQKKLDLSRGENDYNARLDKKSCPKCGVPQSYSEFRDKKKKCQMCGVEFRFVNAWGDIEHGFNSRMAEAARAQAERKQQIYAQVTADVTNRRRVAKSAKQLQYEKRIAMKQNKQTFLDRNYKPNGDSKTKKAQLELEAKRKAAKTVENDKF
ncbi:uncharacterized protein IUM83_12040 [Phytophthora cinnamomi]|uniref:uncharacterized protein n=1 Tax=Phytophthora cinnamomi TaxID=4785 RepID=UPI00355AA68A|nr:hypothetical protein IUM83_12040 [Phytophthora cinnamomi]